MKIEKVEIDQKVFKPFIAKVKIETEKELNALICVLGKAKDDDSDLTYDLFDFLSNIEDE